MLTYKFLNLLLDFVSVRFDICCQSVQAFPKRLPCTRSRVNRLPIQEALGYLKHGLLEGHGHRVEIAGVGRQAESECLEWDRSAAAERVEHLGQVAVARLEDLGAGLFQDALVVGCFPRDESFEDVKQPLAFALLIPLGGELVRVSGGVVDERRPQHRAGRGERSTGPPQVQRGGMAVADRLFTGRFGVDGRQRQRNLDQLLLVGHGCSVG